MSATAPTSRTARASSAASGWNTYGTSRRPTVSRYERAHILLGHVDSMASYQICRGRCEVEAELVAYLVCTQRGIDALDYSLPYVARWADGDIELVRRTADRVVTVARSIVNDLVPAAEAA